MNGAHDMGGMHGMGPIEIEENEPVFHAEWERRAFAITLTAGAMGKWNLDMSRHARENTPPVDYLRRSYYEMWLHGLETLLVEKGLVSQDEIAAQLAGGHAETIATPSITADKIEPAMAKGATHRIDSDMAAKFRPGDHVVVRDLNPLGHTRAPRYVRGRRGIVERDHGVFIYPDSHAADGDQNPQHCYSVRFAATELWGGQASPRDHVHVDLWDDYLDLVAP